MKCVHPLSITGTDPRGAAALLPLEQCPGCAYPPVTDEKQTMGNAQPQQTTKEVPLPQQKGKKEKMRCSCKELIRVSLWQPTTQRSTALYSSPPGNHYQCQSHRRASSTSGDSLRYERHWQDDSSSTIREPVGEAQYAGDVKVNRET